MEVILKSIVICFQKDVNVDNRFHLFCSKEKIGDNDMTEDKDNRAKCSYRIRSVNDKFDREMKRIDNLNEEGLKARLDIATDIPSFGLGGGFSIDQLRHLNTVLLLQSSHHEMSIALCRCAKDYDISVPENIESPKQFHEYILEQMRQKRK